MMWMIVLVAAVICNVVGFCLALKALVSEHRARSFGELPWQSTVRRTRKRVRQLFGLRERSGSVVMGSGEATSHASGSASAYTVERIDPLAPAHEQVATLDRNMQRRLQAMAEVEQRRDAAHSAALGNVREQVAALQHAASDRERQDELITRGTIHAEMWGLTWVAFGTLLSAVHALFAPL